MTVVNCAAARANEFIESQQPQYGWPEVWGGADATKDVWLLYTGITLAPLSKDIYSDGLRFRMNSGYGQYHYDGSLVDCSASGGRRDRCTSTPRRFEIDVMYTDVLVGYHMRLGELTAKAFAGASVISHHFSEIDPENRASGIDYGPTGALEFWLNLGQSGWTSLDLSYTTAHETGSGRWRAGWRVLPTLSIGPEARYDTNTQSDAGRLGLFARYEWFGGEISAAAGLAQKFCKSDDLFCFNDEEDIAPYATLNMLTQF